MVEIRHFTAEIKIYRPTSAFKTNDRRPTTRIDAKIELCSCDRGFSCLSTPGILEDEQTAANPPYWIFTSGFDFDHLVVIGMSFCVRGPNFIQIGPPQVEL